MATIYEIAKEVGVSPSTVARALRGTGYCSQEKRALILAAAERMHYVPSHAARSLKSKRTQKILFCIPDLYNPFYFGMIEGASEILAEQGYFVVLAHTRGKAEVERQMLEALKEGYGDGMILVSFDFGPENIRAINRSGCPVVLTNYYQSPRSEDHFDCVYIDTFAGIYSATKHFLQAGLQRIGYIGGSLQGQTGLQRFQGFQKAMEDAGAPLRAAWVRESDFTQHGGEQAMESMLTAGPPPEACVVANDLMAIGAMRACRRQGLRIPEDIAFIGMDDSIMATCVSPALTSVSMREEEIGRTAATLLLERIDGTRTEKRTIRLAPGLTVRESSERQG